jgi:tetratricopeptide (TPR) repeat protein
MGSSEDRMIERARAIAAGLLLLGLAAGAAAKQPPHAPIRSAAADAEAYAHCLRLAKEDPPAAEKFAAAWQARGGAHPAEHCAAVALFEAKKYKEAAARFDKLAAQMGKGPAWLRAGVLDQGGQAWLAAGNAMRAYADAGAAVMARPNDPDLLVDRAEAAFAVGYADKAVGDLSQALKIDPKRVDALVYRAAAYRALKRLDPALADADEALRLAPNSVPALLERGNIRSIQGNLKGAQADWRRVEALAPHSPAAVDARDNLAHLDAKLAKP